MTEVSKISAQMPPAIAHSPLDFAAQVANSMTGCGSCRKIVVAQIVDFDASKTPFAYFRETSKLKRS